MDVKKEGGVETWPNLMQEDAKPSRGRPPKGDHVRGEERGRDFRPRKGVGAKGRRSVVRESRDVLESKTSRKASEGPWNVPPESRYAARVSAAKAPKVN